MKTKLPWLRLYTEIIDDEKLLLLAFEDRWHYIALLACKGRGILDKDEDPKLRQRKIAVKLGLSVDELLALVGRLAVVGLVSAESLQPSLEHIVESRDTLRPAASVWAVIRDRIFRRDDYTCRYCGSRGGRLECDHVHPVAKGGSHDDENLATACFACNRSKHAKLLSDWVSA